MAAKGSGVDDLASQLAARLEALEARWVVVEARNGRSNREPALWERVDGWRPRRPVLTALHHRPLDPTRTHAVSDHLPESYPDSALLLALA